MKAEGIEYDERMKELEKVEYPKPNRDFVYATFNEFAEKHPWVGTENIRPKSVAREMAERFMTFGDYVREYELQRSEGLLLRYLTESYKTLVQTVPAGYRDETLDDVIAFLRTTVRGVDSSLLDEWERLRDPAYQAAPLEALDAAGRPAAHLGRRPGLRGAAADRAAPAGRGAGAQGLGGRPPRRWPTRPEWPPARLEAELAPYFADHPASTRPRPRASRTRPSIKELEPRRWEAVQRLVDEAGEVDWMVQCQVDLDRRRSTRTGRCSPCCASGPERRHARLRAGTRHRAGAPAAPPR